MIPASRHSGNSSNSHSDNVFYMPGVKKEERLADIIPIKRRDKLKSSLRKTKFTTTAAVLGMISPAVGISTTLWSAFNTQNFSWSSEPLSSILNSPNHTILAVFSSGLVVAGGATAAFSKVIDDSLPESRLTDIGTKIFGLSGLSLAAVGLSFGPMHIIHDVAANTYFFSAPTSIAVIGASMLSDESLRKKGIASIIGAAAAVGVIGVNYVLNGGSARAVFEAADAAVLGAWSVMMAWPMVSSNKIFKKLFRRSQEEEPLKEAA